MNSLFFRGAEVIIHHKKNMSWIKLITSNNFSRFLNLRLTSRNLSHSKHVVHILPLCLAQTLFTSLPLLYSLWVLKLLLKSLWWQYIHMKKHTKFGLNVRTSWNFITTNGSLCQFQVCLKSSSDITTRIPDHSKLQEWECKYITLLQLEVKMSNS